MAKRKNKQTNTEVQKTEYKNPDQTIWGKIILWILVIGFAGLIVLGAIAAIIVWFI